MKVLFNATDAVLNTRALQRYVAALAKGLPMHREKDHVELAFFTHRIFQVRSFLQGFPAGLVYRPRYVPLPRKFLRRRFAAPHAQLRRLTDGADLYHESTFDSPRIEGIPVVTTIHGLAHLEVPDLLPADYVAEMNQWIERAVETSTRFICVSKTTEDELHARFDLSPEQTSVIPQGIGSEFCPLAQHIAIQQVQERFGIEGQYILYVGGIQANKNIPLLMRVFTRLVKEQGFRGQLVLVGDTHYPEEDYRRLLEDTGVADRVRHVGFLHPGDKALPYLYRAATLFLFPSFYEGWTSPPLEAMACGTPVVASNCSSIPETLGGAAMLVHPGNELGWVEASQRLIEDMETRSQYIQLGLMRAALFTWKKTVQSTWRFYRDIVHGTSQVETKDLDEVVV